jgi:hypothetical protein
MQVDAIMEVDWLFLWSTSQSQVSARWPVPASACVVSNRGVRSPKKRPRVSVPSGGYRQGKTEWVNASKASLMPRYDQGLWMGCVKGRTGLAVGKRRVPVDEPVSAGRAPLPRGTEDTRAGRVLHVRNVTIPLESDHVVVGRPTVREAQFSSGRRIAREANAGGRKETGNRARQVRSPLASPDNRPDTGRVPGPKGS